MIIDNSKKEETGHESFESTEDYLSYLQNTPQGTGILSCMASSIKESSNWSGTDSIGESYKKAINGDSSIMATIAPIDVNMTSNISLKRDVFDVAGDRVDVGRYCSGEPDCMVTSQKKGKPIVKILINGSAACFVNSETILERGKAILNIMSGLESNGYSTEIVWISYCTQGTKLEIKLKSAREYFDLAKMSYWLVCPSVLRRLSFAWKERLSDRWQSKIGGGYGTPCDLSSAELEQESDCVYFPMLKSSDTSVFKKQLDEVLAKYAS